MNRAYFKSPVVLFLGSQQYDLVDELQKDLNTLGFDAGTPDGIFGRGTEKAVQLFQEAAKLPADGMVGPSSKVFLSIWIEQGHTRENVKTQPQDTAESARLIAHLIAPRVPHFSQADPRWAGRILGDSSLIGRKGCAISCVAMTLCFYGRTIDPGLLDIHLDAHDGYVGDSIRWNVALSYNANSGPRLHYDRKGGSTKELLPIIRDRIERNLPTMIRVDYGSDTDLAYNHFVLGVGLTREGHIIMNDPATRHGDAYENLSDNVIQDTRRKQGYIPVAIDWYEPVT